MSFLLRREEVLDGEQLSAMLTESPARAAQAILLAAGEGEVEAQALLGQILLDGQGIAQDQPLALRWFGIAAGRGHLMARNMLGRCHEHGWGCAADAGVAAQHYRVAAQAGLDWAMYNLANLLATGRGVTVDQPQALALYRQAAELGHAKSMNLLGRYLEEGRRCRADPSAGSASTGIAARRQAGDFRGQFSYAAVLAERSQIEEASGWYRKAMFGGHAAFLGVAAQTLESAAHPAIQALAQEYKERAGHITV
jgi:TPR repeat protein